MPRFWLQLGSTEQQLRPGATVVGRAQDCEFIVDDLQVSRRHARFTLLQGRVTVEDLKSRNGIYVNSERVERADLRDGDVILIGTREFRLIARDEETPSPRARERQETVTGPVDEPTETQNGPVLVSLLVERLLNSNSVAPAERMVENMFSNVGLAVARGEELAGDQFDALINSSVRLTSVTGRSKFLSALFLLALEARRCLLSNQVDTLVAVAPRVRDGCPGGLVDYLVWLRLEAPKRGPAERFTLQRLETLLRLFQRA